MRERHAAGRRASPERSRPGTAERTAQSVIMLFTFLQCAMRRRPLASSGWGTATATPSATSQTRITNAVTP